MDPKTLPPVDLPPAQSPGFLIRDTHLHLLKVLRGFLKAHNVSTAQWFLLRVLWSEEGLSQRQLSDRVGTTEPTTQSALRLMEERGIIRQVRSTEDRRTKKIFLTESGRRLETELIPFAMEVNRMGTRGMSEDEIAQFIGFITRIRDNLVGLVPPNGEKEL
jgi:DNA-binding MarR family transcriptional regulator